jgi:hypothetical protein
MSSNRNFTITIDRFDGLAPAYWLNAYTAKGNKGHASSMTNVSIVDPNVLTQGPALADLTNGNQASAVTTLIKGMLRAPVAGLSAAAGVGGNKLYKFTASTVTSDGNFPHTIDKGAVTAEDGEDVAFYKGAVFYSYNHSGASGDVGRWTGASTFDDDYMSTVPSGASTLTGDVPHQMLVGGDDQLYVANGRYIGRLNNTIWTPDALDIPSIETITSIAWNANRLYVASVQPNVSSGQQIESSIYVWDTVSSSWEYQIKVYGYIGALYAKNGVVYLWYSDTSTQGVAKLAYVNGAAIRDLNFYQGSVPLYYQVIEDQNHLIWNAGGQVWYFGAATNDLPTRLFPRADAGYTTSGGITNAYGTPMVASYDGATNYRFAQFSGYDVTASWKSLMFDIADGEQIGQLDRITLFTEPMATGAAIDATIRYNYGAASKTLAQVAYSAVGTQTRHHIMQEDTRVENFRLDLSWANGSAVNPVKIRKIIISGHYLDA